MVLDMKNVEFYVAITSYLNNWCLLESIGTDHPPGYMTNNHHDWDVIKRFIHEATQNIFAVGTRVEDANPWMAGFTGITFDSEDAALLLSRQHILNDVGASQGFMNLRGCSTWICEYVFHTLPL